MLVEMRDDKKSDEELIALSGFFFKKKGRIGEAGRLDVQPKKKLPTFFDLGSS